MSLIPQDDPPVREFADRGIIWLLEFPPNMAALLRLVASKLADVLDFSRAERVNRSLIPDNLKKREADLILRVPFKNSNETVMVYLLFEHQSKSDRAMAFKLLGKMNRLWELQWQILADEHVPESRRHLEAVIPFVFYTGKRTWKSEISLTSMMQCPEIAYPFTPHWDVLFLSLNGLTDEQLSSSAVTAALRVLRVADAQFDVLKHELQLAMEFLESLPEAAKAEWRRAIEFLVLLVRHKRPQEEQPMLYNVIDELVTENHREEVSGMGMTIAEADVAKGIHIGQLNIVMDLLQAKFEVPEYRASKILYGKSDSDLSRIARQLLTAKSLEELKL